MNVKQKQDKPGLDTAPNFGVKTYHKLGKSQFLAAHRHDSIELLYALRGELLVEVNDTPYTVKPGDMLVIFSGEEHKILGSGRDENAFLEINYDRDILLSSGQSASGNQFLYSFASAAIVNNRLFVRDMLAETRIPSIFDDLQQENDTPGFSSQFAIRLYICQLSLWILRSWKTLDDEPGMAGTNSIDAMNTLQKIFAFVDGEYMNKIKMETIANQLNMSYYSFSKFFVAHTGKTFPGYVNEVRLTKSKILLTSTGMNITEIAMEVGYISASHFIQRFRESNSMTPQQFRKEFNK